MKDFSIKLLILSLTFLFVFNHSSIAYAGTNYSELKTTQNNEIIRVNFEKPILYEKNLYLVLNDSNKIAEPDLNTANDFITQAFNSYFFSCLFSLIIIVLGVFLSSISMLYTLMANGGLLILILLFPITNAYSIYSVGKSKNKHSYLMTLIGTILGLITYYLSVIILVYLEGYANISNYSNIDRSHCTLLYQNIFIVRLFEIIGGTIFYNISEEKSAPNEPIKASMSSDELMNKIKNDFSFAEKIKVKNGAISLKIAGF